MKKEYFTLKRFMNEFNLYGVITLYKVDKIAKQVLPANQLKQFKHHVQIHRNATYSLLTAIETFLATPEGKYHMNKIQRRTGWGNRKSIKKDIEGICEEIEYDSINKLTEYIKDKGLTTEQVSQYLSKYFCQKNGKFYFLFNVAVPVNDKMFRRLKTMNLNKEIVRNKSKYYYRYR